MNRALILGSLAALTIAGNALGFDAISTSAVTLSGVDSAGRIVFDSHPSNVPPSDGAPFGSCRYQGAWYVTPGLGTAVSCDLVEQRQGGHLSCLKNARIDFATTAASAALHCGGFDENGEAFAPGEGGITMALAELPGLGLVGVATYGDLIPQPIQIKAVPRRGPPIRLLK